MGSGQSALGKDLAEIHEAALEEAAKHCHYRKHAVNAVQAYLDAMYAGLEKQGFLLSIVKIQDEQDN